MDMSPEILLKAYVRYQSEDAFRELVTRTLDAVYSTSLRVAGGTQPLAEEIAVRVYLDLARKAPRLSEDSMLASWLRERTCKAAVTVLHEEDRPVDRAVLKREKEALPMSVEPAPPGLANRICYGIFLKRARRKGFGFSLPRVSWPAWRLPAWARAWHLGGAAVCLLAILIWWNNPFHRRNPIVKLQGVHLTPASFAQLASPEDGGTATKGQTASTNGGTNTK